jgi:O-antigen ligase
MTLAKFTPYLWMTAFLCSLFFINNWQLELFGGAIILVGLWAIVSLGQASKKGFHIPQSWCLRIMGGFWLLAFLSILGSDILNISIMAFCFFSVMPLSFLVMSIDGNRQSYLIIGKVLFIIFAILSVWALIQFFFLSDHFKGRATHPLKNPNSLAALLSLGFFCGVGLALGAKEKWQRLMAFAFAALVFAGVMATGSRGALFALAPVMGVFLFFMRTEVIKQWKPLLVLFVLCVGALLLSSFGGFEKENLIHRVVETVSLNDRDISNNRFALWAATWGIIKEHGVLGTGIGTYFLYFPEFRLLSDSSGAYYAHSDPLQYWVEFGVLGPILFYAFIIAVTGRTIQAVRRVSSTQQRLMILTPFFALAACMLHTHVTFNLYNLSILFAVGFLLSFWFYATQEVLKTSVKTIKFPESYSVASRITAITLPFMFIVGIFTAYIVSEHYTNKARDHLFAAELNEFANDVLMANKISLQGNYRSYLLAVNVPMTLLQEGKNLSEEQRQAIFNQAIGYLKHVQAINPRSASALYYLAKIQQLVPKDFVPETLKTSQEYYERALELDPIHIGARIELSYIYERDLLSMDRAVALIEQGVTYRYSSAKAMDLYGRQVQLYLKVGDTEKRNKAIERMRNFQKRLNRSSNKQVDKLFFE